jgi:hypothetical protein
MRARHPAIVRSLPQADTRPNRSPLLPRCPPPIRSLPPDLLQRRCAWPRDPLQRLLLLRCNDRKNVQASPRNRQWPNALVRKTGPRSSLHRSPRVGPKSVRRLSVPRRRARSLPRVQHQKSVPYRNNSDPRRKLAPHHNNSAPRHKHNSAPHHKHNSAPRHNHNSAPRRKPAPHRNHNSAPRRKPGPRRNHNSALRRKPAPHPKRNRKKTTRKARAFSPRATRYRAATERERLPKGYRNCSNPLTADQGS